MTTKTKKHRLWLPVPDGSRLCLDGYPIEIRRSAEGLGLFVNDRAQFGPNHEHRVDSLKEAADCFANEIDEFDSWEAPKDPQSPGEAL